MLASSSIFAPSSSYCVFSCRGTDPNVVNFTTMGRNGEALKTKIGNATKVDRFDQAW